MVWNDFKPGASESVTSANEGSDRLLNMVWKLDNYYVPFASNPVSLGSKCTHFKAFDSSIVLTRHTSASPFTRNDAQISQCVSLQLSWHLLLNMDATLSGPANSVLWDLWLFTVCNEEEHMAIFIEFKCFYTILNAWKQSVVFNCLPLFCKTLQLWSHSKLHFSDIYYGSNCCFTVVYFQDN